jgi:transcriptional regulator of arginine metabolism
MKSKNSRLDAIKIIISCKEIGSQEELLQELAKEGFRLTQATLSRDLKQLKVAKAASMNGNYVYVLPNNTMYKRMTEQHSAGELLMHNGIISGNSSQNFIKFFTINIISQTAGITGTSFYHSQICRELNGNKAIMH